MVILAYAFLAVMFAAVMLMGWYVLTSESRADEHKPKCQVKSNFTSGIPKLIDANTGKQMDIKELSKDLQEAIHKVYGEDN